MGSVGRVCPLESGKHPLQHTPAIHNNCRADLALSGTRAPCVENQASLHVGHSHNVCGDNNVSKTQRNITSVGTGVTRMWWAWGPHKNEDPNTTHGMGLPIHDPKHPPACPLMWGVETSGGKRNKENM